MNLVFDENALENLKYWIKVDRKKALKILLLIEECAKSPLKALENLNL